MNNSNPTPKTRGARGRIDLLRALAMAGDDPLRKNALAAVLDFYPKATTAKQTIPSKTNKPESKPIPPKPDLIPQTQPAIRFLPYHLVAVETLANEETWQPVTPELRETQVMSITDITRPWQEGLSQPTMRPIVPWTRLWPKLRRVTARTRLSGLDIAQLTQQLSLGKAIRYLPRKPKLGWPTPLRVVFDFSDRLTPYWNDWHWLRHHLQQRLKKQAHCYRLHGVPQKPLQIFQGNQLSAEFKPWPAMSIGDTLLIVSDLGMIDPAHPQPVSCWQEKLSELARNNIHIIVLSPASQNHLQPRWLNRATLVRLSEDSCLRPVQNRQLAQKTQSAALSPAASQLLTMMSIGTLIEPVLLRALRLGLPERSRDAGLEGEIWCHRELYTATTACAISPWAVQYWREKFNQLPETLQQHTLNCLLHQHAALPQAIHHEEILIWQQAASRTLAAAEQHNADQAREFFNQMADTLLDDETKSGFPRKRLVQMADRHTHWAAELLKQESYIHRLSVAISKIEPERNKDGLPQGIDPAEWLRQSQAIEKQMMQLIHTSHQTFDLTAMDDPVPVGSTRLATLEIDRTTLLYAIEDNCRSSLYRPWPWHSASMDEWPHPQPPQLPVQLKIAAPPDLPTSQPRFILHTGRNQLHFSAFEPPVWASAWGQDRFGLFVDLTIGQTNSVTQRFRWIAPGAFLMGSPETEAERSGNEIQHEVTLTRVLARGYHGHSGPVGYNHAEKPVPVS